MSEPYETSASELDELCEEINNSIHIYYRNKRHRLIRKFKRDNRVTTKKNIKNKGKTAFIFSGGGNKGAYQVGLLSVISEYCRPDLIVGTSVGALNGVAYALSPDLGGVKSLRDLWFRISSEDVFPRGPFYGAWRFAERRKGVFPLSGLRKIIEDFVGDKHFEDLKIPTVVVATSLSSGEEIHFNSGGLVDCLLGSCALPGVFPPHEYLGQNLIDGGVLNNTPISIAIKKGFSRMVVFSCNSHNYSEPRITRPVEAMLEAFFLGMDARFKRDLAGIPEGTSIYLLSLEAPPIPDFKDFTKTRELFDLGKRIGDIYVKEIYRNKA